MKLSILIVTYNHEKYIAQALESVLMQEVDFDYEIVVGEDCSTDNTRDILLAYHRKYPLKFKLLLHDKNQGACTNFVQSFKACSGDYIAYLEGDDYWTSTDKLKAQVDLLDSHPEYAICFHNCEEFYENGSKPLWNFCSEDQKEISTLEDLISKCNFIPSCSAVFRNNLFNTFPDWYSTLAMGDWTLHILNAQHGDIVYINKVMGKHRHHGGCTWSLRNQADNILDVIHAYKVVDTYLSYKYKPIVDNMVSAYYCQLAQLYADDSMFKWLKYLFLFFMKTRNKLNMSPKLMSSVAGVIAKNLKKAFIDITKCKEHIF